MKLLLLCVTIGLAVGYPMTFKQIDPLLLDKPMTELRYEELLPVVKETVTSVLHRTIPPGCTHVAIPFITVGMVRIHTVHILRDVLRLLESSTVGGVTILDSLDLPLDTPIDVHLTEVNAILMKIKRISVLKNVPITMRGINHVTPTQVKLLELYKTIASLLQEYTAELTAVLPVSEPIPFHNLLVTILSGEIDLPTYTGEVPTLRRWLSVVTREVLKVAPVMEPEMCRTLDLLPTLVPRLEDILTRVERLSVSDIVQRLPTTISDVTLVKDILPKILPVVNETTPIVRLLNTLKASSYETEFLHFVIDFSSERLVTTTIKKVNTGSVITDILRNNEALLMPAIQKAVVTGRVNTVAVEPIINILTKMTVVMRSQGLPLMDCVEILAMTFDIPREDMMSMVEPVSTELWESRERNMENYESIDLVENLVRKIAQKI